MPRTHITIVAFGNSITLAIEQPEARRWTEMVRGRLEKDLPDLGIKMVNAGVGGNTSREGLQRIEQDVLRHPPDYVTVEFGGNDPNPDDGRRVSLEEFRANLEIIREKIASATHAQIILLTFPPIIDAWHGSREIPIIKNHGGLDACIEPYRQATREFATSHHFSLVDIDLALRGAIARHDAARFIRPDGVHLTEHGNEVVAEEVGACFSRLLAATGKEGTMGGRPNVRNRSAVPPSNR